MSRKSYEGLPSYEAGIRHGRNEAIEIYKKDNNNDAVGPNPAIVTIKKNPRKSRRPAKEYHRQTDIISESDPEDKTILLLTLTLLQTIPSQDRSSRHSPYNSSLNPTFSQET